MSDPTNIFAWLRLDDRLTTSGQPSENQLAALYDIGVEHVVNLALHTHEKALPDEAGAVRRLGMRYTHIPVDFDAPREDDYRQFCSVMEAFGNAQVHVHCIVNARVSAFLYRYRREVLGLDEQVARDAMARIWKPGGVWASFIGDHASVDLPHRYTRKVD